MRRRSSCSAARTCSAGSPAPSAIVSLSVVGLGVDGENTTGAVRLYVLAVALGLVALAVAFLIAS